MSKTVPIRLTIKEAIEVSSVLGMVLGGWPVALNPHRGKLRQWDAINRAVKKIEAAMQPREPDAT